MNKFEIITFKDGDFSLPVNVSPTEDTVWLTKEEIAILFERDRTVISRHISNIYSENELSISSTRAFFAQVQKEGERDVSRTMEMFNLDMIISVGYRVKSQRGIIFRKWATSILKQYMLQKQDYIECKEKIIDLQKQIYEIKYFQQNSLTLKNGERIETMFMLQEIMKNAKHLLVIIDNYFDHSFDEILLHSPAKVVIITHTKNVSFESDKYKVLKIDKFHDRYLFVDDKTYHFGESFNKLGTDVSTCTYMPNFTIEQFLELTGIEI